MADHERIEVSHELHQAGRIIRLGDRGAGRAGVLEPDHVRVSLESLERRRIVETAPGELVAGDAHTRALSLLVHDRLAHDVPPAAWLAVPR